MHRKRPKLRGNAKVAVWMNRERFENIRYLVLEIIEEDEMSQCADVHLGLLSSKQVGRLWTHMIFIYFRNTCQQEI